MKIGIFGRSRPIAEDCHDNHDNDADDNKNIGLYRIRLPQIQPDLAGFRNSNPAAAIWGNLFSNHRKICPIN